MILVTGGTGLVGSHLLYSLTLAGNNVKALVRTDHSIDAINRTFRYYTSNPESLFSKIEFVYGDVTDIVSLEDAFRNVTQVYHTAAYVSFNQRNKRQIHQVNVEGTANIVNLCLQLNIQKLCFVSSIAAFGTAEPGKQVDELTLWKPTKKTSAYSLSKVMSELEVWRGITEGLNAVIVNPSVILGPGNWNRGSSQLFSTIDKGFHFYTNGTTGYVDVRDVVKAMVQLMESDIAAVRYLLSSENISYYDLFSKIAYYLNVQAPQKYASPLLTAIAWRIEKLKSIILFTDPKITKTSVAISHKLLSYSSKQITTDLGFTFTPISETIQHIAHCYRNDKK